MGKQLIDNYKSYIIYKNHIGDDQLYLTISVEDKSADSVTVCRDIYEKIVDILKKEDMEIVYERIFGSLSIQSKIINTRLEILGQLTNGTNIPYTYIQGQPIWGEGLAGIHIRAIKLNSNNDNIWTIFHNNIACGRGWIKNNTRYIFLQNLHSNDDLKNQSREEQADIMFELASELLKNEGVTYKNVVRTWIYLSNILGWYDEFNLVRNRKYKSFQLIPDKYSKNSINTMYLPASTGIQGENNLGTAAIMDLYAVEPEKNSQIEIESTSGAIQNAAFHYGSAFSRAISINEPDNIQILVSGTASIDEKGISVFENNAKAQINQTFKVISALIKEKGASLEDIYDSTIYLKRSDDISHFYKIKEEYGLDKIPAICVLADICRDELLFEVDAVAVLNNKKI